MKEVHHSFDNAWHSLVVIKGRALLFLFSHLLCVTVLITWVFWFCISVKRIITKHFFFCFLSYMFDSLCVLLFNLFFYLFLYMISRATENSFTSLCIFKKIWLAFLVFTFMDGRKVCFHLSILKFKGKTCIYFITLTSPYTFLFLLLLKWISPMISVTWLYIYVKLIFPDFSYRNHIYYQIYLEEHFPNYDLHFQKY